MPGSFWLLLYSPNGPELQTMSPSEPAQRFVVPNRPDLPAGCHAEGRQMVKPGPRTTLHPGHSSTSDAHLGARAEAGASDGLLCAQSAKKIGKVVSFTAEGQAFDEAALAKCNEKAR